jgi:hypothetical protein
MMFSFKIVNCILHLVFLRAYGCLEASDYWHRDRRNWIHAVWRLFGGHLDFFLFECICEMSLRTYGFFKTID